MGSRTQFRARGNSVNASLPATGNLQGGKMSKISYAIGAVAVAVFLLWLKSYLDASMISVIVAYFFAMIFYAFVERRLRKPRR
jgi:VIT1/CCC1 family predicted Fe2+/Mn2+ transporter